MKNTTGYYKNIIFLFVLFAFIRQPVISQSLIVDGIDLMEGFTFGVAAEEINTTGYNVWTVTNTDDEVFDVVEGSLRWAVEQVNKDDYKEQNNYIHFDIPGDGPHIISLETELPEIKGNVVIDGELSSEGEPEIIINGVNDCNCLFHINNYDTNAFFYLQKITLKNGIKNLTITSNCKKVKIHSNIINTKQGIKPANPTSAYWYIRLTRSVDDLSIKGNILGTDIHFDTNYSHELSYAIITSGTKYTFGGNQLNDRNVFANCWVGTSHNIINSINNLYFNLDRGLRNVRRNTSFSKNLFYKCNDAIENFLSNNNANKPQITYNNFIGENILIKGVTINNRPGETIEVFLGTSESTEDAIKYLGSAVSDANGEWELSSGSSGWADPSFIPQTGDIILATSTYDGQTSDFSDTAKIPCMQANLVITDPATACTTDLTDPAIIKGSTGGNDLLIPHSGLVTEDPSSSTDHFTDMDWWGSEDGTPAINDNDETTSWRARPRNSKTNYFIIDMQAIHDISKIEVICGDETFSDGVCEVYIADWRDNSGDYKIQDLSWTKVTEFGPADPNTTQTIHFNGEIARFIKFQLTTTIDKDYWKINEVNIYKHQFSYYQDADAAIPLTEPEHITTSGTYYIKMGDGACTDIKPVQVTIDPMLCTGCPCNININNPEPACSVDLTSASITAGTKGGNNEIIDNQGFVTENHTNSGDIYTDMTWWDEEGHPEAMTDTDLETYWHARPRANQANYFIINMQEVHEISRIEIFSGDHVFNEGVCEIYTAYWDSPPYTIETLEWKKKGQFGPVSKNATKTIDFRGDSAQFIKFRLTTSIDKDYWDIRQVNIYRHAFTIWEDAAATIPLATPENVTTSGTYYIKSGDGSCADIQPVDVTIDPDLCNPPCNLVVKDPPPADDYVDLTDPALREGTSGNGYGMTDNSSYTCPNNMSDLDWWDDADGLQAMLDNDPNTYFHAQARSSNTNYFTIDMQAEYLVGEIDITSGWNVFDEGTCSVYLSKDNTNWAKAAEFGPIQINATQNIKIHGIEARYIKFELNTSIDKDYWDITGINIYQHEYSYWKDEALTEPLEQPANITQSGTYYVKLKAGTCEDSDFVEVKLNNCNQFIPPTIVSDKPALYYIPCQNGYTNDPITLSLSESYSQYAWYQNIYHVNLDSGLVAHYPFNGNAVDETGNGYDGTVNGAVLGEDRFGNAGSAYQFDGQDDYIFIGDHDAFEPDEFSISLWCKRNGNSILNQTGSLFTKYQSYFNNREYTLSWVNNDFSKERFRDKIMFVTSWTRTSPFRKLDSAVSESITHNDWVHVIAMKTKQTISLYINGKKVSEETTPGPSTKSGSNVYIGAVHKSTTIPDNHFNGLIDDIRFYNRPLNKREVEALYNQNGWNGNNVNLQDGLAAYYPFSGNANDESGNGNDGELKNNPSLTTDRFGNFNSAYEFDGVDDYIHIPHSESIDITEKITISAWVVLDQSNDYNMIIAKRSGHTTQYQISVRGIIGHRGDLNFFTGENHVVSYDFPTQQWVHVLATADDIANETKFYVDGELVGVNTDDLELKSTDKFLRIGENSWNNGYWEGKIDDVRIYNRILNDEEIQALYGQASTNPKDIISNDPSLQVSEPGTYYVDVFDANGCTGTANITINEQKEPGYEDIFAVTNTKDEGEGSLRAAIEGLNNSTSGGEIIFCIPGQAPHTIDLYTQLPAITKPVKIDGATQPANGYTGDSPLINIRGIICNSVLEVTGGSGTIIRNIKFGSDDDGIVLSSNNTQIENCIIHAHAPLIVNGDGNSIKNSDIRVKEELESSTAILISGTGNTIGGHDNGNTIQNPNPDGKGIVIETTGQQNLISENKYMMDKISGILQNVIILSGDANNNMQAPEITYLNFHNDNIEIDGSSSYSGDIIEIYTLQKDGDASEFQFVTSVTSSIDNKWHATISGFDFTGQHFMATSTYDGQTSEFSDSDTIQLRLIPEINTIAPKCPGDTFSLSATISYNLTSHSAPPYQYVWNSSPGTMLSCTDCEAPVATIADTTTYYVTITDADGLTGTDSITVNTLPVPVANAGADQTICAGGTATLTATGGTSYYWSTADTTADVSVQPLVTTTYMVSVTNEYGCTATDEVEVVVHPPVNPNIISGQPALYYIPCQDGYTNDPITLSLSESYEEYTWYKDTSNLDSGLIAYYPFNANAVDETGNGHDGTVNGSVLTTDRFGNPNSAYDFDGVDDYIELNDNKIIITQMPFSISIWAKIEEYTDANYIFCQRDKETSHGSSFIGLLTDNTYSNKSRFGLRNSGLEQLVKFEGPVCEKEEWHLYTATVDESGNVKFYIDNQIEATGIYNYENSFFDNINMVAIGAVIRDGLANYYFNGMIDDVRIYSRALNNDEIQALYGQSSINPKDIISNNPSIQISEPGSYSVDVTDANGCIGISEIIITEQKEPGYEDIYAVTNTNNIGKGSLRNAIIDINTSENGGEIIFCIPGEAPHTINLTSELPPVTKPIQMDGNTQPRNGYQGNDYLINISSSGFSGELLQINCDSGTTLQNIVFESEGEGIALSSGYAQIHHCHIHGQTPLLIHGDFNQVFDNVLYVNDNVQNSKAIIISGSNNTIGGHDNTNKIRNYNATANGIIVQPSGQQNKLSENEFLMHIECPPDSVHRLMGNANNNMEQPEITYINFYNGNIEIEGTSVYNSDVIEIYAVEETVAGNIQYKYVASVTSLNNTWHTTIHDFDYSGQLFSATSTLNNNTSEFSTVKEASSEIISGPNQLCLGESAAFSTTLNPANIDNYTWDMGDGTTYSEPGITHTYADSGVYTVTLTVGFNSGETEEFKKDITVLLTPDLYVNIKTNTPEEKTVTLNATQDTYVSKRNAGRNFGSEDNLYVENREFQILWFTFEEEKRALIKFDDLSSTLPSDIQIVSATMTLHGNGHRPGNNGIIARVINSWDESNTDWNNQPEYTLTNKKVLYPPNSMDQNYTIDITDFVEEWYDNVETNHGVIIYFPESVRDEQRFRFYSRETDDEANKPRLEITYRFNTTTVCEGEQVSVNVSGADAYTWAPNDYLSCTDCHNPVIIPYDTSGYQVVGLNANGCTDTAEFTINTLPAPVADAGPDLGICPGTSVILSANEGEGLSYAWSPADGLSCNDCRTPTASPDQTTVYTLTVSNAAGCSATDQVLITMPDPAIYDCFDHAMMLDMNGQDYWCSDAAIYTNEDATPDHAKPSCMNGGPIANKWFKFTATTRTIKIILSTGNGQGTLRNPYLTLWNQNGSEMTCEQYTNPDDDLYLIYNNLQRGSTYYFSVDSDDETRGTFSLCLSNGRDNDFFQFATEIANPDNWCAGEAKWKQDYTTVGATRDMRGSSCMRRPQYNKWFKFKAIGNRVTVSASPEGDNPIRTAVIALWDNRRREVDCHSAGPAGTARLKDILVTPGEWYYVSVDNRGRRTNTGRFDLCINSYYDYDYAEGAKIIDNAQAWCSRLEAYTTVEATPDRDAGSCWNNGPNNNRWFKFIAVSGYAEITLKTNNEYGTISRAYIAVWDDDYTEISCSKQNNPGQDEITITANNLTPGEWYYISVDNYSRFSLPFFPPSRFVGTFSLCIQSDFDGNIFYSIADGDWDDNIWSFDKYATIGNGQTPGTDDMVIIYDHTVTLRHDATISKALISVENRDTWLIMQGGNLNIENGLQIIKNCP